MAEIAEEISQNIDSDDSVTEQIGKALGSLFEMAGSNTRDIVSMDTACNAAIEIIKAEQAGTVQRVSTGIPSMDQAIGGGMRTPHLIILAGRPGTGKTALAVAVSNNAAKAGNAGLFFSLEMGAEELLNRVPSCESGIPGMDLESGKLSTNDLTRLEVARRKIRGRQLYIDDTSALNVEQIISRARLNKERFNIKFIVVDHIQRMSDPQGLQRANRTLSLGTTVQGLKKPC